MNTPRIHPWLIVCALFTVAFAVPPTSSQAAHHGKKKPNILVIMVDDLGFGDLSSHGAKDLKSPHIDGLMSAGIRFNRFYANCPVCSPTRASFITGRYPERVGVPGVIRTYPDGNFGYLKPSAVTIADMMKKAGYETSLVGKWHLGLESPNKPNERGFDYFHGFLCDMIDDYWKKKRHGINYMRLNDTEISPEGHATDLFSQWAAAHIKEAAKREGGSGKPWFMFLAYNAPHTPIHPPKDWLAKVKAREKDITDKRAKLVALIEHMDDGIGQVIAALKASGQADNTLIIFTSDNGGQVNVGGTNGPLRGGKQDMYEGGIRVSTCAVWPGKIKPGSRTDLRAITMDLFPTLCEVAGVKVEHKIDGVSILPTLLGKEQKLERDLFYVRREGNTRYQGQDYHAMHRGPWKLLYNNPFEPMQLFNLEQDPMETTDVSKKNRKVFNEMTQALRRHIQQGGRVPWQKPEE